MRNQSRREFIGTAVAAYSSLRGGLYSDRRSNPGAPERAAMAAAPNTIPEPSSMGIKLYAVLSAAGKSPLAIDMSDGTKVLALPYGGRVIGLFASGSLRNFYWTNPALDDAESARAFFAGTDWQNSGGDRTWLAPEVDVFLPEYPKTETYFQPRDLDPGHYRLDQSTGLYTFVNDLELKLARSKRAVKLRISKHFGPAPNPLRYEKNVDASGVAYAGYAQYTTLESLVSDVPKDAAVGLWNLVQMPHGGDMLFPTYGKTEPKVWFGNIGADDLIVNEHLVRYKMRARGEHKLGIRAVATTGRVGYLYKDGDETALVVRNYVVNPSGEYVDVPWKDPDDLGYSTQACNVNSKLGAFSELEYHIPAILGKTGLRRCDDAAQVWAYRGPDEAVRRIARVLVSPEA